MWWKQQQYHAVILCRTWRQAQLGFEAEIAQASAAFRPAHEHEWFNRQDTVFLKEFAERAQLSFAVVKYFSNRGIIDADLIWLTGYQDARMLSDLGLTSGQAFSLRNFCAEKMDDVIERFGCWIGTCDRWESENRGVEEEDYKSKYEDVLKQNEELKKQLRI